jgi:hypothetical protein
MSAYKLKSSWVTLIGIVMWTAVATAQFPEKFTNLQILPKDISRADLQSTMRGFAFALNVRCNHCHVEKMEGKMVQLDFPADDKETKKTVGHAADGRGDHQP